MISNDLGKKNPRFRGAGPTAGAWNLDHGEKAPVY